jgi:hypothetical protein
VQWLKLQARMSGVGLESSVAGSGSLLHVLRQLAEVAAKRWVKARDQRERPSESVRIERLTLATSIGFEYVVDQPPKLLGTSRSRIEPALIFVQLVHEQLRQPFGLLLKI